MAAWPTRSIAKMNAAVRRSTRRFCGNVGDRAIRFSHISRQFVPDTIKLPTELLNVLYPLEVTHCDSAGVGKNVWNDEDATLPKDLIRFWGRRRRWQPRQ